jgi:hypothetical protein
MAEIRITSILRCARRTVVRATWRDDEALEVLA